MNPNLLPINYSPLFSTLQAIKAEGCAEISSWRLVASKIGVSGSLGGRLVSILIGYDFFSLTQLAKEILANSQVSAQHKMNLVTHLKNLSNRQKFQAEASLQEDQTNIRFQAEVNYFKKVSSKLDDVLNGEGELDVHRFKDPIPSLASKIYTCIKKWLLRPIFGLSTQERIKIIDYYFSNGKKKLSEDLKSFLDPSHQDKVPSNAIFIKFKHRLTSNHLNRIREKNHEALASGKSLIICYQDNDMPILRIITPPLNLDSSLREVTYRFGSTSWQRILVELNEKVINEREKILKEACPFVYNLPLLQALNLPAPEIHLNQNMNQLSVDIHNLQNGLSSQLAELESPIKAMTEELKMVYFRPDLWELSRSSNFVNLYEVHWNDCGIQEESTFNSLLALKKFVNIQYFNYKIPMNPLAPQISSINHRPLDPLSEIYGEVFISLKRINQGPHNHVIRYASYLDPFSGTFIHKEIDISADDAFKNLEKIKQELGESLRRLAEEEKQLKVELAKPGINRIWSLFSDYYRIERKSESDPTYSIHTPGSLYPYSNLFGWQALQNKISEIKFEQFLAIHNDVMDVTTHKQRKKLGNNNVGISKEAANKFTLHCLIPGTTTLASIEINDLDKDFHRGLERLKNLMICHREHRLTNKTLKQVSSLTRTKVPPMPKDLRAADLSRLLNFFDKINFEDKNKPYYVNPSTLKNDGHLTNKGNLRNGLVSLIHHIQNRERHSGVPNNLSERLRYYNILERYIRNIIHLFNQKLEKAKDKVKTLEEIQSHVITLATASSHCGGRWNPEVVQVFNILSEQCDQEIKENLLETTIHSWIDQFKTLKIEEMTAETQNQQNSHGITYIKKALHDLGYLVPDAEASTYHDIHQGQGIASFGQGQEGRQAVAKKYVEKMSLSNFYSFLQDRFNQTLEKQNRECVLNPLRESISLTEQEKDSLDEKGFNEKKNALLKLQREPQPLTINEEQLLTQIDKITLKQWTAPSSAENPGIKQEIDLLKKNLAFLVQQKPDQLKSYTSLLNKKGCKLIPIQEQLYHLVQRQQTKVAELKDQKLEERGLLTVSYREEQAYEEKRITIDGTAALLKHFGFIERKPGIRD